MTTQTANGRGSAQMEFEAAHYSNLYSTPELEDEWEAPEAAHYSNPEMEEEWETPEAAHYSNPYSNPEDEAAHYSNPELEDEAAHYANPELEDEATHYSNPEMAAHYSNPELEDEAAHYSNPYSNPEMEEEWETPEAAHYANPEWEEEAARHIRARPQVAARPHAIRITPRQQPRVIQGVRRVIPHGKRIVPRVVHSVLGSPGTRPARPGQAAPAWRPGMSRPGYAGWRPGVPRPGSAGWIAGKPRPPYAAQATGAPRPGYAGWRPGMPRPASRGWIPGTPRPSMAPGGGRVGARPGSGGSVPLSAIARRTTVSGLFRQLSAIFGEGESEAAELEAHLFGANEFEGEIAGHEASHEAALTEVLAAEAAHTESESEAEALLGAALPITITIMGGRRALRSVMPTLARGNARLVRGIHRSGPTARQLLRAVPTIQRRTIASLRAAQRSGRRITPRLVTQVLAGQAARVLGTSPILGRALVRNTAIRQSTVAPARRRVRPRRAVGM